MSDEIPMKKKKKETKVEEAALVPRFTDAEATMILKSETDLFLEINSILRDPKRCFGDFGVGKMENLLEEVYHANPAVSAHKLMKFTTPRHMLSALVDHENKESPALRFGRLVHSAILTPDIFTDIVVTGPECYSKAAKAWKDFVASNPGKVCVTPDEMSQVNKMARAMQRNKTALDYLSSGLPEVSFFHVDKQFNICTRGRTDFVSFEDQIIVDYKTCATAEFREFEGASAKWNYHLQGSFYRRLLKQMTGQDFRFVIVAQEKESPYEIQSFEYGIKEMEFTDIRIENRLKRLDELLNKTTNEWEGYQQGTRALGLPGWEWSKDF